MEQGRLNKPFKQDFGSIPFSKTCTACGGAGKTIKEPCQTCRGKGRVKKTIQVKVKIPAGIEDGQTIRLENQGEVGYNGGPKGDLHLHIRVKRHSIYERKGDNVHCEIPITYTQAVLGADLEIPMVDGSKEKYKMPEGTATNTKFTIRSKGFKSLRGNMKGDFIFTVVVQIPKKLTPEQKELLLQLAKTMNEQPPVKKKGLFNWD